MASGDVQPKAIRVKRRTLVFVLSTSPLDSRCSRLALIEMRCLAIRWAKWTKAGIRQRLAQASQWSSRRLPSSPLSAKDLTQLLLEQVGPVEAVVDRGAPGQLGRLLLGEVFGVLPQRVPGVFEVAGVPAEPLLAGRVPGLAANLVQRVGGPRHDVERICAAHGVGALVGDLVGDPRRGVGRDVRDGGTPGFTEGVEELRQRLAVSTRRGPHQPATVVIHDESDVSVPALVADLPGRPGAAMRPAYPARSRSLFGCLGRARGNEASRSESSRPSTPCCNRWFGGWSSRASRTWRWSRPGCTGSRSSTPCARAIPWRSCWSTPGM